MKVKYYFLCVLTMLFWGMSFVWLKVVFEFYNPISVIFFRLLFSSMILLGYQFIFKKTEKILKRDYKLFCGLAFFQPFLYFIGESFGLLYVSSTVASVIISTIPVVTPLFTFVFLKERISIRGCIGIFVSFIGVLLIVLGKDLSFKYSIKGLGLLILAVLSAIGYSLIVRKMTHRYSPLTLLNGQNVIGALYFLPLFIFFRLDAFLQVQPNFSVLLNFSYLVVFASIFAFLFFNISIKELGVNISNLMSNLIPIFTTITAYFIIHEPVGLKKVLGITIVIFGLFLANYNRKDKIIPLEI